VTSPCTVTATSGICGGTPTQPICYKLTPTAANCPATILLAYGGHRVVPSEYRSAAIYGSLKYDVGAWSLSGELRYSKDKKTATQADYRLYTTTAVGTPSTYKFDQSSPSYAATVSYRFNPSTLAYAKTGTGYRAGGVNNGAIVAVAPNPLQPTYDNENTTSYEVGVKSTIAEACSCAFRPTPRAPPTRSPAFPTAAPSPTPVSRPVRTST
jgi:iron complex outermembrane receptor protein